MKIGLQGVPMKIRLLVCANEDWAYVYANEDWAFMYVINDWALVSAKRDWALGGAKRGWALRGVPSDVGLWEVPYDTRIWCVKKGFTFGVWFFLVLQDFQVFEMHVMPYVVEICHDS